MRHSEHVELLKPGIVDDRDEIVEQGVEGPARGIGVRHPHPAHVASDQPPATSRLGHPVRPGGRREVLLDMVEPYGRHDEGFALARCRIGDLRAVGGPAKLHALGRARLREFDVDPLVRTAEELARESRKADPSGFLLQQDVIVAVQRHESGSPDPSSKIFARGEGHHLVVFRVKDHRRRGHPRQEPVNVDL